MCTEDLWQAAGDLLLHSTVISKWDLYVNLFPELHFTSILCIHIQRDMRGCNMWQRKQHPCMRYTAYFHTIQSLWHTVAHSLWISSSQPVHENQAEVSVVSHERNQLPAACDSAMNHAHSSVLHTWWDKRQVSTVTSQKENYSNTVFCRIMAYSQAASPGSR